MQASKIEWTDSTWNPIVGCTKVSVGCKNCYAERMALRLKSMGVPQYQSVVDSNGWTGKVEFVESALDKINPKQKPRRIFVCSMGDLFHPVVKADDIITVMEKISSCPQHTFVVLTKRPERIVPMLYGKEGNYFWGGGDSLPNLIIGYSASTATDLERGITPLFKYRQAGGGAPLIALSLEPLLGGIQVLSPDYSCTLCNYVGYVTGKEYCDGCEEESTSPDKSDACDCGESSYHCACPECGETEGFGVYGTERPDSRFPEIDWVIVGHESGTNARHGDFVDIERVVSQCVATRVPVFVKQAWVDGKLKKMPEVLGRVWDQYPERRRHDNDLTK